MSTRACGWTLPGREGLNLRSRQPVLYTQRSNDNSILSSRMSTKDLLVLYGQNYFVIYSKYDLGKLTSKTANIQHILHIHLNTKTFRIAIFQFVYISFHTGC